MNTGSNRMVRLPGVSIVMRKRLAERELDDVLTLVAAASAADGVAPLGESTLLRLRDQTVAGTTTARGPGTVPDTGAAPAGRGAGTNGGAGRPGPSGGATAVPATTARPGATPAGDQGDASAEPTGGQDDASAEPAGDQGDAGRSPGQEPAALVALAYDGPELAGAGVLDGDTAELVVHPEHRRRGHGRAIAGALLERAGAVNAWAHGELPGAVALARSLGFERFRALWKMRRPLGDRLPEPVWAPGVRVRTFRVGADEDAWLRVNARAFAHHPEQGRWTRADLERRECEPWFSAAGFFLAERDGELLGFHWTKVHADEGVGEVYVVGVDPAAQGLGLGRALTLAGLRHLEGLGLPAVVLYADESNTPATGLYEKLGFTRESTDAMFRSAPATTGDPRPAT